MNNKMLKCDNVWQVEIATKGCKSLSTMSTDVNTRHHNINNQLIVYA